MGRTVGNQKALILNLFSLLIGLYGLKYTFTQKNLPAHLIDAGQWQFLTNLSLAYSMLVFLLGAISHFTKSQQIYRLKNNIHPIGLALECVVASVYWPLRLFFLHLLVKDPKQFIFPVSVDLSVHLMPVVSLATDYFFFMPKWTIKKSTAFAVCALLTIGYWFWLHHLIDFQSGGRYPYQFLEVENNHLRIALFSLVGLSGYGSYLLMNNLYELVITKENVQ